MKIKTDKDSYVTVFRSNDKVQIGIVTRKNDKVYSVSTDLDEDAIDSMISELILHRSKIKKDK